TGIIYGKKNVLDLQDYIRFFEIRKVEENFFCTGEQGFLNLLFFNNSQKGKLRLSGANIQFIVPDFTYEEAKKRFPIPISNPVNPQFIHWAGPVKPMIDCGSTTYVEPMTFFRKKYLSDLGINDE